MNSQGADPDKINIRRVLLGVGILVVAFVGYTIGGFYVARYLVEWIHNTFPSVSGKLVVWAVATVYLTSILPVGWWIARKLGAV